MNILLNLEQNVFNDNLNNSSFMYAGKSLTEMNAEEYNELAIIHKEKGLFDKVIFFYSKALLQRVLSLGESNIKSIRSTIKLAEAYLDNNMSSESLSFYEKSLELSLNNFGANSLEVASIYSALANIHFNEDSLEEAFSFYLKALDLRKNMLGENHPLTAMSQHELGYFYAVSKEYSLALPFFEKSLKTRVELYRHSHPETARSYNSLAMCEYHLFNYDEAYKHLLEAIRIKVLILPRNDKSIVLCKKNLLEIKKNISRKVKHTFLKNMFAWIRNL